VIDTLNKQYQYEEAISLSTQTKAEDKLFERLHEVESFSRQFLHAASTLYNIQGENPVQA